MRLVRQPELPFCADDPSYIDDWAIVGRIQAMRELERLYNNGCEFYPRRILEAAGRVIHSDLVDGDTCDIEALNGKTYQYRVRGWVTTYDENGGESPSHVPIRVICPAIDYMSLSQLLLDASNATIARQWRPFHAYCTVRLANYIKQEDEDESEEDESEEDEFEEESLHNGEPNGGPIGDPNEGPWGMTLRRTEAWPVWDVVNAFLSSLRVAWQINSVFGIGCGSLEGSRRGIFSYNRFVDQHAFVYHLANYLQTTGLGSQYVARFFQDSTYTNDDTWTVEQIGEIEERVTVLPDPVAYLAMDKQSVVFSSRATCCVKSIIADNAMPAILILDRIRNDGSPSELADPFTPRVKWMLETHYQFFDLPQFHVHGWVPLGMYVRNEFIPPSQPDDSTELRDVEMDGYAYLH